MAIDQAKAVADYPALEGNEFWKALLEECEKRLVGEFKVMGTTDDLPGVYRSQGRADVWSQMRRLPEDLISRFRR